MVNPKSNDTVLVVVSTTRGFDGASITTGLAPVDVCATKRGWLIILGVPDVLEAVSS